MKNHILCMGSLVIDNYNDAVREMPGPNQGTTTAIHTFPGGNSFNIVKNLVNLDFPPDRLVCAGAVGEDFFGDLFSTELDRLGIGSALYRTAAAADAPAHLPDAR